MCPVVVLMRGHPSPVEAFSVFAIYMVELRVFIGGIFQIIATTNRRWPHLKTHIPTYTWYPHTYQVIFCMHAHLSQTYVSTYVHT